MKKRLVSLMTALILCLGLLPAGMPAAYAGNVLKPPLENVSVMITNVEQGTMQSEMGLMTGRIVSLMVKLPRVQWSNEYVVCPLRRCEAGSSYEYEKMNSGTMMPFVIAEPGKAPRFETIDGSDGETGPNGEKITDDGTTLTVEKKVCINDETSPDTPEQKYGCYNKGDSIIIEVAASTINDETGDAWNSEAVMIEIPASQIVKGKTFTEKGSEDPAPSTVEVPKGGVFTYDGKPRQGVEENGAYTLGGTYLESNAGTYTATVTLADGYTWTDGSKEAREIQWTIKPAVITSATYDSLSFTYDGNAHGPNALEVFAGDVRLANSEITMTGKTMAAEIGVYEITVAARTSNVTGSVTDSWEILADLSEASVKYPDGKNADSEFTETQAEEVSLTVADGKVLEKDLDFTVGITSVSEGGSDQWSVEYKPVNGRSKGKKALRLKRKKQNASDAELVWAKKDANKKVKIRVTGVKSEFSAPVVQVFVNQETEPRGEEEITEGMKVSEEGSLVTYETEGSIRWTGEIPEATDDIFAVVKYTKGDGLEYFTEKIKAEDDSVPGDVTGDGVVDGKDPVRLMKYLAGEIDPETGKVYAIHENNADVTGDGINDEKDLVRLTKYLGGEKVTLEEGKVTGN